VDDEDIPRVSWRRLEFAGVTAFAVAVSCLLVGQAAELYAARTAPEPSVTANSAPKFNVIDYATTGATKGGVVIIGPCDERGR
jgi:hypothetical protein